MNDFDCGLTLTGGTKLEVCQAHCLLLRDRPLALELVRWLIVIHPFNEGFGMNMKTTLMVTDFENGRVPMIFVIANSDMEENLNVCLFDPVSAINYLSTAEPLKLNPFRVFQNYDY
jgi:hypothetical protein